MDEKDKNPIVLSSKNVNLWYGKKKILHGINLDFNEKGITSLIGPSGSGKSTYLRTLNRMHDLFDGITVQGNFELYGKNIYSPSYDTVKLRKNIGMVFQQPSPFPFSIYENVAFGLKLDNKFTKEEIDFKVEDSLKKAAVWNEVKDRLNSSALGLSGGQQQRILIARSLATSPKVLLLDEPTSALDPVSSSVIEESLVRLRDNYTMIIVTHNMQQASRISDETAFFNEGRLVEFNTTKKIFLDPDNKETQNYVSGRFG